MAVRNEQLDNYHRSADHYEDDKHDRNVRDTVFSCHGTARIEESPKV